MPQLHNRADTSGVYEEITNTHFTELSVELSALQVEKTADKPVWVKDNLQYTIVVTNLDDRDPGDPDAPGLPVTEVTLTDKIDTNIADLVPGSVYINGAPATELTDYTYVGGILSFITLADLPPGGSHTIVFEVARVPQP